jgi:transposase-like protein
MRKSKFSESQIVKILKAVEGGRTVKEVCREHGVSNATFYKWKSKCKVHWLSLSSTRLYKAALAAAPLGGPEKCPFFRPVAGCAVHTWSRMTGQGLP